MSKWMAAALVGLGLWVGAACGAPAGETAETAAKSLEQIARDVRETLARERIRDVFDLYRKLKDHGASYQASLVAPEYLGGRLFDGNLRMYAGMKMFDALYAATFLRREAAADAVGTIEQIQDALELRSYADLSNPFLGTLKAAAAAPEEIDVRALVDQLASDYVAELPELLSSPQTADYLIDALYGFFVQYSYVTDMLMAVNHAEIEAGFDSMDTTDVYKVLLDVFEAFDRMDETIRIGADTAGKMEVMRTMYDLVVAERSGELAEEEAGAMWLGPSQEILAIRESILEPKHPEE
jgi:hypothetical protein